MTDQNERDNLPTSDQLRLRRFDDVEGAIEDEIQRKHGFLTPDDREFLMRGPGDRSERAIKGKETRLLRKGRNAILDLGLYKNLSADTRGSLFSPGNRALQTEDEMIGATIQVLSIIFPGLNYCSFDSETELETISKTLEQGLEEMGGDEVSFSVAIERHERTEFETEEYTGSVGVLSDLTDESDDGEGGD